MSLKEETTGLAAREVGREMLPDVFKIEEDDTKLS
jgi:hypothetical protein